MDVLATSKPYMDNCRNDSAGNWTIYNSFIMLWNYLYLHQTVQTILTTFPNESFPPYNIICFIRQTDSGRERERDCTKCGVGFRECITCQNRAYFVEFVNNLAQFPENSLILCCDECEMCTVHNFHKWVSAVCVCVHVFSYFKHQ